MPLDPNVLNKYFAEIATDNQYDSNYIMKLTESVSCRNQSESQDSPCTPLARYKVQNVLRKCKLFLLFLKQLNRRISLTLILFCYPNSASII